ncbi:MAG: hypothetical protein KJ000_22690 [Pirellulaceae bacterium]|nr:hypothetical protein [Pirellulaceae bacterium]
MKFASSACMLPGILLAFATVGTIAVHAVEKSAVYRVELSDPVAPGEPPRVYEIVASDDENGFPAGYALSFQTHVCIDEQCRMVRVTMHWNALGYYQRLECPPDLPLTRKQHVPFTPEDYAKLDRILMDRDSILGGQPLEALVKPVIEAQNPEIDGLSGATPQTVKDSVVEDAAYTTWTMWHWANGEIVPKLQALTEPRVTSDYLRYLLRSEDRRDVDFALRYLQKHPPARELLVDEMFHVLLHGDREHVALSLELLDRSVLDKRQLHGRLIEAFCSMSTSYSPMVLDYFAAQPELPAETLEGLSAILSELPYFQVHLTLRLLDAKGFCSEKAETYVAGLLDHDNFFIARRASEHLSKQAVGETTKRRLETFREQHRDRL